MGRQGKRAETNRKRALSRARKLRGSLKAKPSLLDSLLKERRREHQNEERELR